MYSTAWPRIKISASNVGRTGTSRAIVLRTSKGDLALEAEGTNGCSDEKGDLTGPPSRACKKEKNKENLTIRKEKDTCTRLCIIMMNRQMDTRKTCTTRMMTMSTRNSHSPSKQWSCADLTMK